MISTYPFEIKIKIKICAMDCSATFLCTNFMQPFMQQLKKPTAFLLQANLISALSAEFRHILGNVFKAIPYFL